MPLKFDGRASGDAHVNCLLEQYGPSVDAAVLVTKDLIPHTLRGVHIGKFEEKQKGLSIPAKETTLVDASLGMVDAVKGALELEFPSRISKLDPVLARTVAVVASLGNGVVAARKKARDGLRRAAALVAP